MHLFLLLTHIILHRIIVSQLFERHSIAVLCTSNYTHIYEKCDLDDLNNEVQKVAL
jgi:hypothetical protein